MRRVGVMSLCLVVPILAACTEQVTARREVVPVRDADLVGDKLSVFVGSSCNGKPTAKVEERATQVRLTVETTVVRGGDHLDCADGVLVTLRHPLGTRAVVDASTERPLHVQRR